MNRNDSKLKRTKQYEFIELDKEIEKQIKSIKSIRHLTEEQIYYMVLRDGNDFIDIFSGYMHSWRHLEYKRKSREAKMLLNENVALSNFTHEQFMSAFKGLEWIFCKNSHQYDDYLIKVLLPEALIRICSRVYECDMEDAETFLRITHKNDALDHSVPTGSKKQAVITLD